MIPYRADELAQRGDTATQCGGHPVLEELFCRGAIAIIPDVFELILEHPGTMDTAIGVTQVIEESGLPFGTVCRVHGKQPALPLDRFTAPWYQGHATRPRLDSAPSRHGGD